VCKRAEWIKCPVEFQSSATTIFSTHVNLWFFFYFWGMCFAFCFCLVLACAFLNYSVCFIYIVSCFIFLLTVSMYYFFYPTIGIVKIILQHTGKLMHHITNFENNYIELIYENKDVLANFTSCFFLVYCIKHTYILIN
jgi:hypothetical protein